MVLARQSACTAKFRVFAQHLPMRMESAGIYTIGLLDTVHSSESEHIFPLPVLKLNPLIQISGGA